MVHIRFSGLCGVIHQVGSDKAEVVLVEPTIIGGPAHSATLMVENHQGLIGVPDAVVGDPARETVYGVWNLSGSVSVAGPDPFTFSLKAPTWGSIFPDDDPNAWRSMKMLPNYAEIADSEILSPRNTWPQNAIVSFTQGSFEAVMPAPHLRSRRYNFLDSVGKAWPTNRPMALQCQVSFGSGPVTMTIPRGRGFTSVTIDDHQVIVITNASAGDGSAVAHGDVAYELLKDPKRKARFRLPLLGIGHFPTNPDECGNFTIITT